MGTYSSRVCAPEVCLQKCYVCKHMLRDNYLQCKLCATSLHYKCVGVNNANKTVCSYCGKVDSLLPVIYRKI